MPNGSLDSNVVIGWLGKGWGMLCGSFSGRGGGGVALTADFDVLSNESIVPTKGTAGTFSRASALYIATSPNAISLVASGNPPVPAHACGISSPTHTLGGYYALDAITNYCLQSHTLGSAPWGVTGTATATDASTTGPDAVANSASLLTGGAANDSVLQDTGTAAANNIVIFSIWLKASGGSRTVTIKIKDAAASSASSNCTVTTSWQQFTVPKRFVAAAGNISVEVIVNDTTGYQIFAFGAGLYSVYNLVAAARQNLGIQEDQTPTITTAAAAASVVANKLSYAGAELTTSVQKRSYLFWIYWPNVDLGQQWTTMCPMALEGNAFALISQVRQSASTGNIAIYYDGANLRDTGDKWVESRWNQLIVACDGAGDNEAFLNGVSIHTSADAFAANAVKYLIVGNQYSDFSGLGWNNLIGRIQYYSGTRLSATQALSLYDAQKGDYGI